MKSLVTRIQNWKLSKDLEEQRRGFYWIAGELLRGADLEATEMEVNARLHSPWAPPGGDPFDKGCSDAVRAWSDMEIKNGKT